MRRLLLWLAIVAVVAAAGGAFLVYRSLATPFQGYPGTEQFVDIPPGAGTATIGRRLVDAGVIRDRLTWRLALLESGAARDLKAGEYRFSGGLTPHEVIGRLARGEVYVRQITFPEGLTIREMARLFEARGFGSAASFEQAATDVSLVREWDPAARDLEGYLFPETDGLTRHADAATRMHRRIVHLECAPAGAPGDEYEWREFLPLG